MMQSSVDAQMRLLFQKTSTKIHKLVMNDRKLKVHELADIVKISDGSVFTILHEHLGNWNLSAKWVPRELTVDQKQQWIDASEGCLALLNRNKMEFYRRYVTMDETWLHYYTPERNLSPMMK